MSGAADDQVAARIDEKIEALRLSVDRLAQGLTLMVEAQAAQGEMLRQLLQAAASPGPAENPVATALSKLSATITAQTLLLQEVGRGLARLPEEVGREVTMGLRAALGEGP
jgi:hypothetical protein